MTVVGKATKKVLRTLAKQVPGSGVRCAMLRMTGCRIGNDSHIGEDLIIIDELDRSCEVTIGDRVAIAPRVTLVTSSHPNSSKIRSRAPVAEGPVKIEHDAWIGTGAIILPNVTVGEGAVVGAGSVVTTSVEPYTIVIGQPAKPHRRLRVSDDD